MTAARKIESFEITINNDSEIQYAFAQVLRNISKMNWQGAKPVVLGVDMEGHGKVFSLSNESNLEELIRGILGEVTVESYGSDTDPGLIGLDYIPVSFVVKFITSVKRNGKT